MAADFLNELSLTADERAKLESFGAQTPMALLSIRRASPEAFDRHIGIDRAASIARELELLLNDDERKRLRAPLRPPGPMGARLEPPPAPKPWR